MTLILFAQAESGEVILAADRQVSGGYASDGAVFPVCMSDDTIKLKKYKQGMIGLAGNDVGCVLFAIDAASREDHGEVDPAVHLSKSIKAFFKSFEHPVPECTIFYCDWMNGRGRFVRIDSANDLVPRHSDLWLDYAGHTYAPWVLARLVAPKDRSVSTLQRLLGFFVSETSKIDKHVGPQMDIWTMSGPGVIQPLPEEAITEIRSVSAEAVKALQSVLGRGGEGLW